MNFLLAFVAGVIADSAWFFAGRRYGAQVMRIINRMSFHPPTYVRHTRWLFDRRGRIFLIVAKFLPGVSLIAPLLAGQYGMGYGFFLSLDGIGSALWVSLLLASGRYFGDLIKREPRLLNLVGHFAGVLILVAVAGLLFGRLHRRRAILKALAASRLVGRRRAVFLGSLQGKPSRSLASRAGPANRRRPVPSGLGLPSRSYFCNLRMYATMSLSCASLSP